MKFKESVSYIKKQIEDMLNEVEEDKIEEAMKYFQPT